MKILTIVGARPQFIKAAAVSRVLRTAPDAVELMVHTGQHYDDNMSDVFFQELEIDAPQYRLAVGSASHGAQTGRMLERIESVIIDVRPDWVLVYGDTNSTLAGALAASKLHVRIAHVEAGLRSFNRQMPEEINRVATDHMSTLLFAPTDAAVANLEREGIPRTGVHLVGDVMYDAALYFGDKAERVSSILQRLDLHRSGYVLATVHRAENTDDPDRLRWILEGLQDIATRRKVVLPLHPRTSGIMRDMGIAAAGIHTIAPVGYLDMVMLERNAELIVTDSGGVQKEAYFYRVPCVTLRDQTEWVELVEAGWNRLVSPAIGPGIATTVEHFIRGHDSTRPTDLSLYGAGKAAMEIVRILQTAC